MDGRARVMVEMRGDVRRRGGALTYMHGSDDGSPVVLLPAALQSRKLVTDRTHGSPPPRATLSKRLSSANATVLRIPG